MRYEKLSSGNLDQLAAEAGEAIKAGGVVVLPFDTVYGLICDPKNDKSLQKIFDLKNRSQEKTIGTAVDNLSSAQLYGQTALWDFASDRIPGPYTFILNAGNKKLSSFCYKDGTIAVRLPKNELVTEIARKGGGIIAQTSANKSGMPNCFSVDDIKKQFDQEELDKIDLIIDGGEITDSQPSEIYDLTGDEPKKIER